MQKKDEKEQNPFRTNTPLEYIGMGFFLMLIGGAFFAAVVSRGESLTDFFDEFVVLIWGSYLLVAPFILFGLIRLFGSFGERHIYSANVTLSSVALAHWTVALVFPQSVSIWLRAIAFLFISLIVPFVAKLIKKRD